MNTEKERICKFLCDFLSEKTGRKIGQHDYDIKFEELGINSLEYIQMVVTVEEELHVRVCDDILFAGKDCSISSFSDLLEKNTMVEIVSEG